MEIVYWDRMPPPIRARMSAPRYAVTEAGCWEWNGDRHKHGYGVCDPRWYVDDDFPREVYGKTGRHRALAHRVAYWQAYGPIPEGLIVRHTCDNPPCVNPAHLVAGTHSDNNRDMYARKRHPNQVACPKGHDRSDVYLRRLKNGSVSRTCRPCRLDKEAEYRARKRGAVT